MRTPLWIVCAVAATGCLHVTHMPACDEEVVLVADDFEYDGWTALHLQARVEGSWDVLGTRFDGSEVDASVRVDRVGGAELVTLTPTTIKKRSFGVGSYHPLIDPGCVDHLRVPVEIDVQTLDGAVDAVPRGFATSSPHPPEASDAFAIWGSGRIDEARMPYDEDSPENWEDPTVFASVTFTAGEDPPIQGDLGWWGHADRESGVVSRAFRVLTW